MNQNKLFGVFAYPVKHSLSPLMHNAAFQAVGLPHYYHGFEIDPDNIGLAVQSIRALGIGGVNVTIPHKQAVMPYLDEIDEEAKVIGAVNTIVQREGRLYGYNTDGAGYVRSLLDETSIILKKSQVLILGTGGATKGIAVYLLKNGCPSITLTNRTEAKANQLAEQLDTYKAKQGLSAAVTALPWQKAVSEYADYQLIINTTSLGMWPEVDHTPITCEQVTEQTIVSDIVYNPLKTKLLQLAENNGASIHPGLGMFVYQGAIAFEYFTGVEAPVQVMKETVLAKLQEER